ncbi:MAG: hypothetical protein P1U56_16195 [Saprospiraceae bacterium]|nr:hypothetical protein [Saprospiraceae bacterium]
MKNLLSTFLFICFCTSFLNGQGLTESYTSFDIRILKGTMSPETGNLALSFTENSIRELEYSFNNDYDGSISYTALEIGLKFGKYKGMSYSLDLSAPLSGQGKGKFGLSVGYNYPIPIGTMDLLFRPSLGFTGGSSNVNIGEISVDTVGIVIADTDYVDRDVNVDISQSACYLIPKLETTLLFEQKFGLSFSVAYDYEVFNNEQEIEFTATDFDATDVAFSDTFIDLQFNGTRPTDNIFTSNGLTFALGISWYYNRE